MAMVESENREISTRVRRALAQSDQVGEMDIDVETIDGIVYLRGEVNTEPEKPAATEVARSVPGVKEVRNQLAVLAIRPPKREPEIIECRDHQCRTRESEAEESAG